MKMLQGFIKVTMTMVLATGVASAALTVTNPELTGPSGQTPTGWAVEGLNLESDDFRYAGTSTAWTGYVLMDMNQQNQESGRMYQQLTGTKEAGTYTWQITELGLADFGDGTDGVLNIGFATSADGALLDGFVSLTEGVDGFNSPANGGSGITKSVSYVSDGTEDLFLVFERPATTTLTGRSVTSVGSTSLSFVAVPEPSAAALMALGGLGLLVRRRR